MPLWSGIQVVDEPMGLTGGSGGHHMMAAILEMICEVDRLPFLLRALYQ